MITELPVTTVTANDLQQEFINKISTQFKDWTDTQASNNMIMLAETISAIAELEYAYVNRLARECFIQFALDPRNVYAHARGLGYVPQFQSASLVQAVIQSASALTADTVIPSGTQFTSILNSVIYETTGAVVIRAGQTASSSVQLAQRQSWTDTFTGTSVGNQQVALNQSPVMPASIVVTINGTIWTYALNFVDSVSTDQVYTWFEDGTGVCTVVFGNGITGKNPPLNATIQIAYQTGGGSVNAVPANGLTTCVSQVTDSGSGALLSLSAYNALAAAPGADVETSDEIRAHAIANLIAPSVLLTRLDVQDAVSTLSGVQQCVVVNWETLAALPRNVVQIFVLPVGGGQPSAGLLASVLNYVTVTRQLVMGVIPYAYGPTFRVLNFVISLGVLAGFNQAAVENAVTETLVNMFNPAIVTPNFIPIFGMGVFMSQITTIFQGVSGVNNSTITSPGDTQLGQNEFPLLGTVTFV